VPSDSLGHRRKTRKAHANAGALPTFRRVVAKSYSTRLPVSGQGVRKTKDELEREARRG
jgi:hypothetical protein